MSTTTVKAVWPNEKVTDLRHLKNSYGSGPVIWNILAKKYLGLEDDAFWNHTEKLWPLYKKDIPRHHRAVLMITYDNALVMKANYKQAAADIRSLLIDLPVDSNRVNHWHTIADIFDSEPDCPAIGFHMTSVSEDPFYGPYNHKAKRHDPPDWSVYWDVYARLTNLLNGENNERV